MNNLWSFDMSSFTDIREAQTPANQLEWRPLKTFGKTPGQVSHHQSIVVGKNMYLIGGSMNGKDYNQSVMYRLDLQSLNWDTVQTRTTSDDPDALPQCIDEHTACLDGNNKVIVFGGFSNGTRVNRIRTFDVELH